MKSYVYVLFKAGVFETQNLEIVFASFSAKRRASTSWTDHIS